MSDKELCEHIHCKFGKRHQRATFIDLVRKEKLCLNHAQELNREYMRFGYSNKPRCISLKEYTFSLLLQA